MTFNPDIRFKVRLFSPDLAPILSSFNPEVPITFSFAFLLYFSISRHLFHSTSMSHLHYLHAISQRGSIVLIILSIRPFLPPLSQSLYCEMNTALSFGTLSSYRHPHQSLSLFFAKCLCLTFISPPLLFSPIGPERRLFF